MALVHCRECGEMISESAPICPNCGVPQNISLSKISSADSKIREDNESLYEMDALEDNEKSNTALIILSFLCPLVGLILFLVYLCKRDMKRVGEYATAGFCGMMLLKVLIKFFDVF
ncbi:MAG: hypothetical protein IKJ67_09050 [Bacteroidales bacterium]|nr:hypothetical protein [Bacteroidales bacterium]